MKFERIRKQQDLSKINIGIPVEAEFIDGELKKLIIDNKLFISIESYSLQIYIPEPPKMVKKYIVKGSLFDVPYTSKTFDYKNEAEHHLNRIKEGVMYSDDNAQLEIEEIEVTEN